MDLAWRMPIVAVWILSFLCPVLSTAHQSSYKGWNLIVSETQYYDYHGSKEIQLLCWLKPFNSSISVGWFQGISPVGIDVTIVQESESVGMAIKTSLQSYGQYTCKAEVTHNATLSATTWLLPPDGKPESVQTILSDYNETQSVVCSGSQLLVQDLYNNSMPLSPIAGLIFTHTFTQISDQFKLVCVLDSGIVSNITYLFARAEPIRFTLPNESILIAHEQSDVDFTCFAQGFPLPIVTVTKYGSSLLGTFLSPDSPSNAVSVHYKPFYDIFYGGEHVCKAANVWEEKEFVLNLISSEPPLKKLESNVTSFVIDPPIVEIGQTVSFCCEAKVRDTLRMSLGGIVNGNHKEQLLSRQLHSGARTTKLQHTITITNTSLTRYACSLIKIGYEDVIAEEEIFIAPAGGLLSLASSAETVNVDGPKNVTAAFNVYPGLDPQVDVVINRLESGFFVDAISLPPVVTWVNRSLLLVTISLDPRLASNLSLITTEDLETQLTIRVSYYSSSAVAVVNVTVPYLPTAPQPNSDLAVVGGVTATVAALAGVALAVMIAVFLVRRHRLKIAYNELMNSTPQQRKRMKLLNGVSNDMKALGLLQNHKHLELGNPLGEGSFGVVYSANLTSGGQTVTVAAKAIKDSLKASALEEFIKELKMLQRIGTHPHIISLVGCCVQQETLYILLEFASGGRLLSYLHKQRPRVLTKREKVTFSLQVAQGMEYLAGKKCVHCDLAARNVLLMGDNTLKVCDFGLARKLYQEVYHKHINADTRLPIKWMALESIERHEFNSQSDVWAFGVLLWEIVTMGNSPYPLVTSQQHLLRMLREGKRLSHPEHCPDSLWTIMRSCWLPSPEDRPTFVQLVGMLNDLHLIDMSNTAKETEPNEQFTQVSVLTGYESSLEGDGYCSYCKSKMGPEGETEGEGGSEDSDSISINNSCQPKQPLPPPTHKQSAKRVDSGDSGICHNCRSECGSTFSMGQSLMTGGYPSAPGSSYYTGNLPSTPGSAYYTGATCITAGSSAMCAPQPPGELAVHIGPHPARALHPNGTHLNGTRLWSSYLQSSGTCHSYISHPPPTTATTTTASNLLENHVCRSNQVAEMHSSMPSKPVLQPSTSDQTKAVVGTSPAQSSQQEQPSQSSQVDTASKMPLLQPDVPSNSGETNLPLQPFQSNQTPAPSNPLQPPQSDGQTIRSDEISSVHQSVPPTSQSPLPASLPPNADVLPSDQIGVGIKPPRPTHSVGPKGSRRPKFPPTAQIFYRAHPHIQTGVVESDV
nr:fibroblast growth factor receptor 3 [Halisarca dujardinii]